MGPALPPHLLRKREEERKGKEEEEEEEESSDEDDEALIGPMPPRPGEEESGSSSGAGAEIEARARRMREKLEGRQESGEPKRETWMLELPEDRSKCFGLGPRQFSRSNAEKKGRDKTWTETPQERRARMERGGDAEKPEEEEEEDGKRKEEDADVLAYLASIKRDQEMEKVSDELKEKRGTESLMEMHGKKLKRKRKEEEEERKKGGGVTERRPFDRDVDLQANRFDAAQKEMMLKRARQLDDRFSRGATKFL